MYQMLENTTYTHIKSLTFTFTLPYLKTFKIVYLEIQFSSVAQSSPTLYDPMDYSEAEFLLKKRMQCQDLSKNKPVT